MKKTLRYAIKAKDRKGITLDILKILYKCDIDIKALEVKPGILYLKIYKDFDIETHELESKLYSQKDVIKIKSIELLPQEEREKYIETVLDAIDEGIVSIDKNGKVTTLNQAAKNILKVNNAVGQHVSKVISPKIPMLETIKNGKVYDNVEIVLKNKNKKQGSHYFTSGRPILDEEDNPIGAVSSLKDIESVKNLVYSYTKPSMITFDDIIGESQNIKQVINMAKIVSKSNSTVLIRGESGTGKELFARSIHMASPRKEHPFVAINCAALPDSLLESELFGYEEGAFTGAKKGGKQGLFKYADTGTIFLDEIGELSTHLQVKLLRVLQENQIRQVGSNIEMPIDVRVITATNRNLEKLIENGQFREDLYYRLNVIPINIPPLRERMEDIPVLSRYYIAKLSKSMNKTVMDIDEEAMKKMMNYNWPGNVRELANIIERAMNICNSDIIQKEHIIIKEENNSDIVYQKQESTQNTLKNIVAEAEKKAIEKALAENDSIRKAAKALGVNHATVINKIKRYNIKR